MKVGKETLVRFLNCETSPAEEKAIMSWLEENESHRKELDELDFVFGSSMLGCKTKSRKRSFFAYGLGRALAYAACALLVAGLSIAGGAAYSNHKFETRAAQLMEMSVPAGQRVNMTLADGTAVTLNSCAKIKYPAVFGSKDRTVFVEGEALFDVAHDAEHPFIVRTFGQTVRALGTKFMVNADESLKSFTASLLEGSVLVSDIASGEEVVLQPGEKASLLNGGLVKESIDDSDDYLWTDGIVSLDGKTFEELMSCYEKVYGFNIIYRTDSIPQIRCKGKIRIADGIEHSLSVLKKGGTKFNYEVDYNLKEIYIW